MTRARRVLALLLAAPTVSFAAQPAVETTVELQRPGRATVRTRISPDSRLARASAFHGLTGDPGEGWRRAAMRFDSVPGGGLTFTSAVEAGIDGWLRVPIPVPDPPPPPGSDLSFVARISPPPGYRIADAFPALTADGGEGGSLAAHLPAPPSFLRFRVVPEEEFAIGLATVVDGALALLLIGLGAFGARRLLAPSTSRPGEPPVTRFSFWGLFAVFGAILLAYWFWMRRVERRESGEHPEDGPP